ncbi:hypothetical protein EVAR_6443_1 [Eumeta japonica]|uniref:Uncharacterized protein n=1 Tax=Eumeta variegata TaxID=151549 RepID=A0A4C1SPY2_EUMVA|nr:hypothetical protein EVAR_6443_1 [Eumeta japonica]
MDDWNARAVGLFRRAKTALKSATKHKVMKNANRYGYEPILRTSQKLTSDIVGSGRSRTRLFTVGRRGGMYGSTAAGVCNRTSPTARPSCNLCLTELFRMPEFGFDQFSRSKVIRSYTSTRTHARMYRTHARTHARTYARIHARMHARTHTDTQNDTQTHTQHTVTDTDT